MDINDEAGDSTTSEFDAGDWSEEDEEDITNITVNPSGSKRRKLSKHAKITAEEEKQQPLICYEQDYDDIVSFLFFFLCNFFPM